MILLKNYYLVLVFILISTSNYYAQAKLLEKVERKGSELIISYEKYQLPNGLTILIHEDHSDPIVYVDVTYHVGSSREQEGRSGFAHFFEHMMFQGTEHIADEEHFKIISEAGGTCNGTTNMDRTNYFETMPSNQLETALWLEADRMGFLLDAVTQKKFEVQRETVKNERGQRYDNTPYGLMREKIAEGLYPTNHPYSWQTIGYIEDLNRVDVNDLKNFFLRWYGPNNATLTVGGDVNTADVIKYVEKYFGSIPQGPEVKPQIVAPIVLESDRYISYEDNIRMPQVSFTFPTVPDNHSDKYALDVLADILSGNESSIFYQKFVKSQFAQSASVYHTTKELASEFFVVVRAFPDKKLSVADSMIRAAFIEFEKRGVKDDDLVRFKATTEVQMVNTLSSVQNKSATLAAFQTFLANPNYIATEKANYDKVTKEDVMRVYEKYIKNKYAVVLSICPKGKAEIVAKPNNYKIPKRNIATVEAAEYKNLVYNKAKDNFDRNKKPVPPPASFVKVPDYWQHNFENGVKLIGAKNDEVPSINVQLYIESGHRYEPLEKAGIAEMLTALLNESTLKHTTEQLADKIELLGSSVAFSHNGYDIILNINSLKKNIDSTLAIAQEMLFMPKFDVVDYERIKKQKLEAIANQFTQAPVIANNVFAKVLYSNNNIMSLPSLGTAKSVGSITLEQVKSYYSNNILPSVTSVVVVGDISKDEIVPKLQFIRNWKGANLVRTNTEPLIPAIEKTKIYLVNKEKAPQSELRIGYMAIPFDATGEYYKAGIMNYTLGGNFNSRINQNLREVHGYTYGARTTFSASKYRGPFVASAGVRANVTDSSIVELIKEIKNYVNNGITDEELSYTKNAIAQSEALKYETAWQKAGFIKRILDYNLDRSFIDKQAQVLKNINKNEVNQLAKTYLPIDRMAIVVVGDTLKIKDGLMKVGYEVIELDTEGNRIKTKDDFEKELMKEKIKEEMKTLQRPKTLGKPVPSKNFKAR
ncbi:MAG: pitrilysin family protein [Bacteroidia bacterium]